MNLTDQSPAALQRLTTGIQTIGGVTSAVSGYQAGRANESALNRQARVTLEQGAQTEAQQRYQDRYQIGNQITGAGAAGAGYGGSTADVLRQNMAQQELAALTTRYKSKMQAAGLSAEAGAAGWGAKQGLFGGITRAGGELLAGRTLEAKYEALYGNPPPKTSTGERPLGPGLKVG